MQLFFSRFEPKALHNAKFWAPTHLFSEVADPTNTRRKFLTALRKKVSDLVFVKAPPQGLFNNANLKFQFCLTYGVKFLIDAHPPSPENTLLGGGGTKRSLRNDNKISRQQNLQFQNVIVMAFPQEKQRFSTIFLSAPLFPPQKTHILFYCRLAVSEQKGGRIKFVPRGASKYTTPTPLA